MNYSNYNKENGIEALCSWPIILLFLYICFPVGIYLIIKKQSLHRRNIFTIGRKTLSTSISLFLVSLLMYVPRIAFELFLKPENEEYNSIKTVINSSSYSFVQKMANLFIFIGVIVLIISIFQMYKGKRYRKYISFVVNRGIENLDDISTKMNLPKTVVIKDLKKMIDHNYLENYDIAEDENRIFSVLEEAKKREQNEKNTRVVCCPNCHANNYLHEKVGKCEYCNSYIE